MDDIWKEFLLKEKSKEYFIKMESIIKNEYRDFKVYPENDQIYNAFELTSYKSIKCVIVGQDPYFNKGEAHGLAFSVKKGVKIPPSLKNIFKELESDLSVKLSCGDLSGWAREGVFLLNRTLTVREGEPNSHKSIGWQEFTLSVIRKLSERVKPMVFMLWGSEAQKLSKVIASHHMVMTAPHPSPLSAYRGFFGCHHFSKCNELLTNFGVKEINWGREFNE